MIARRSALGTIAAVALATATQAASPPARGEVRVLLDTTAGKIVIAVDTRRAPITANNFLRYVDAGKFNGKFFYRAARSKSHPGVGLVQAGIDSAVRDSFFPIKHEPTTLTHLKHVDGTVSMARNKPGTAMGDFFICVGAAPSLDAGPNYAGYAAFGHVVSGMDVAKRILMLPTFPGGYDIQQIGQTIINRPKILSARRLP
jgi:peptidyl-prolyl cis-trans isomerase A (cyclophilin A)